MNFSRTWQDDLHLENYETPEPINIESEEDDNHILQKIKQNERIAAEYNRKNEFLQKLEG